jgi:two-component system, cell cycle response regulator DivK
MDVMQFSLTNIAVMNRNKPIILAVDDDDDNLVLVSLAVEQLFDCSLVTAVDGETALSLAHIYQPDLILLDIRLHDLNGLEVVRRLKQHPDTQIIPIIAVTALAKREERTSIFAAGCDDYLSKPYMLEDLEAVIRRHLRMPSLV